VRSADHLVRVKWPKPDTSTIPAAIPAAIPAVGSTSGDDRACQQAHRPVKPRAAKREVHDVR